MLFEREDGTWMDAARCTTAPTLSGARARPTNRAAHCIQIEERVSSLSKRCDVYRQHEEVSDTVNHCLIFRNDISKNLQNSTQFKSIHKISYFILKKNQSFRLLPRWPIIH
ncbi:uncharacterized protein LOC143912724 isoform X1 [Arctopsyche grandis]|uniref:uncharacterized protein LOC143912724 isoform X1 n=1 Tax=Arctopsyche grandis TaxID=121162 RepID=UPI00406D6408